MDKKETILLMGAGYTLQKVAQILNKEQKEALVLSSTSSEKIKALRELGFNCQYLNLLEPGSIQSFFQQYPNIKIIVDSIPPIRGKKEVSATTGIENLSQVANKLPLNKIIYLSATGVYEYKDGSYVNEDSPSKATLRGGMERLECETKYQELFPNVQVTSFRISAIYGPGRGIGTSLKEGYYAMIDQGQNWSNRIHVDDLASIITLAIMEKRSLASVYCLTDDLPALSIDVVNFYCQSFSLPLPPSMTMEEALSKGKLTRLSNQRVSNKFVKEFFNYNFKYPSFKEGANTEFQKDVTI